MVQIQTEYTSHRDRAEPAPSSMSLPGSHGLIRSRSGMITTVCERAGQEDVMRRSATSSGMRLGVPVSTRPAAAVALLVAIGLAGGCSAALRDEARRDR